MINACQISLIDYHTKNSSLLIESVNYIKDSEMLQTSKYLARQFQMENIKINDSPVSIQRYWTHEMFKIER